MKLLSNKMLNPVVLLSAFLFFPIIAIANTSVTLSKVSGGSGGSPFVDMAANKGRITAITVRSGKFIDRIQLTYQYNNGRVIGSPHGGNGGKSKTFKLSKGEFITVFGGRSGKYVDSIYIKTNKGRSRKWGGNGGGNSFKFKGSKQSPILGIWGRSGALLDAIGVVTANKGGQSKPTNRILDFEQRKIANGGSDEKGDSYQTNSFPHPSANRNVVDSWLNTHGAKLRNIIKSMSSHHDFTEYSRRENRFCGSHAYCLIAYRRSAISYVTDAD